MTPIRTPADGDILHRHPPAASSAGALPLPTRHETDVPPGAASPVHRAAPAGGDYLGLDELEALVDGLVESKTQPPELRVYRTGLRLSPRERRGLHPLLALVLIFALASLPNWLPAGWVA